MRKQASRSYQKRALALKRFKHSSGPQATVVLLVYLSTKQTIREETMKTIRFTLTDVVTTTMTDKGNCEVVVSLEGGWGKLAAVLIRIASEIAGHKDYKWADKVWGMLVQKDPNHIFPKF